VLRIVPNCVYTVGYRWRHDAQIRAARQPPLPPVTLAEAAGLETEPTAAALVVALTAALANARPPAVEPALMDAAAAAAYTAVSRKFLREASLAGEVACVTLRGRGVGARDLLRWTREDLDAWVERSRVPATSTGAVLHTTTPAKPATRSTTPVALRRPRKTAQAAPVLSARDAIRQKRAA